MLKTIIILFGAFSFIYFFIEVFCSYLLSKKLKEFLKFLIMLPFGGIVGIITFAIYYLLHKYLPFVVLMLFGCIIITGLELLGGYLLNIKLKLNIWDYSNSKIKNIPLNFLGQIDLYHSIGWFFITIPIFLLGIYLCK